jgi:trimeric autotransporter adhesin
VALPPEGDIDMNEETSGRLMRLFGAIAAPIALLTACGGGGSDTPAPPPPPPSGVTITGKAVDGALQGATACYDLNDNGVCDNGEPSGSTDASGAFTFSVATADAGKHRVVVTVPANAVDTDTGAAVGTAYTLLAPASGTSGGQSVFVSPLSTLVQSQADVAGQTVAQAVSFVQMQLNLPVSPLADFTAATSAANAVAANASRLVRLTQVQQAAAVAAAVGQSDLSGGTVTQADVDKAVAIAVTGSLPAIGAAAADPALSGVSGAALQTALGTAASGVVAGTGLTPGAVVVAAGIAKLPPDSTPTTPEASAAMASLQYTDANHWVMRVNQSTALDNTPDASGLLHYYEVRTRMQPYAYQNTLGVAESFAIGNSKAISGMLHWNGSAWVACTLGQRNAQTPRDAQGRSSYNNCDNFQMGVTTRTALDISGQSMAAVVANKILPVAGPGTPVAGTVGNGWNLNTALLGTATFPAGSKLFLQTDLSTGNAQAYDVRSTNQVAVFSAAVAAGGDARAGTVACQNAGTAVATTSLEEMVARNPGQPCIFSASSNTDGASLDPSEAWDLSSLNLDDVANYYPTPPAGTGAYYTNAGAMQVGFAATGNSTTYYQCYRRKADNSVRNCTAIGTGTYTVSTLGDARVLSLNNLPAAVQRIGFTPLFIERGGNVYAGYSNPLGVTTNEVRLNLAAAQALTFQLGLPRIQPADSPKALTGAKATIAATLKGAWVSTDGMSVIRFGDNGEYLLGEIGVADSGGRPGLEKGWFDYDPATGTVGLLLAIDSNGDWGLSHPGPGDGITSITPTAINLADGSAAGRLVDDPNGIVGMWAVGSPTDMTAPHFVFLANGMVLSIHPYSAGDVEPGGACDLARQGPPGIEWSDYSFNPATGALRIFNKIYDTNGCGGIFDSSAGGEQNTEANSVITFSADHKTAQAQAFDPQNPPLTLYRIAPQ